MALALLSAMGTQNIRLDDGLGFMMVPGWFLLGFIKNILQEYSGFYEASEWGSMTGSTRLRVCRAWDLSCSGQSP